MQKNIEKQVLNKIKGEKIKPEPKWKFLIRNYMLWFFGSLALVLSSITFSVILYMMINNDWFVAKQAGGRFKFVFISLPYFWLFLLILFIIIIHYNFKNTKKGYKYRLPMIILVCMAANIFLGGIFYKVGVGHSLDDITARHALFYRKIINRKLDLWHQPEKGLLSGVITSNIDENNFQLEDLKGDTWNIILKDAVIMPELLIRDGERIKVRGKFLGSNSFEARRVMPIGPGRDWFRNNPESIKFFNERRMSHPEPRDIIRPRY